MDAVDTNVLVRLATGDDPIQTAAAEKLVQRGVWVSHLVIAEMVWVLRSIYGRSPRQIADAIETLLDNPNLAIQDAEIVIGALAHFRARPTVRFSDCLILEIARKAGHLPLRTFDRDFAKVPGIERLT